MASAKQIFQPYMALGLVCDGSASGCRPCSHQLGLSYFLTTPVDSGRALHLYDINLQLKGVSRAIPSSWFPDNKEDIKFSHLAACYNLTFAAVRNVIVVFHRLVPYTTWVGPHETGIPITVLSVIGNHLVSVDAEQNVAVWPLPSSVKDLPPKQNTFSQIALPVDFAVTCVTHPHTYVNKILLGARDGRCMLLNLNTKKVIHVFKSFPAPVTALEPAPIVDVVAVGTRSGAVHLHNFRMDKTIMTFTMKGNDDDDDDDGDDDGEENDIDEDNSDSMSTTVMDDETLNRVGIRSLSFRSDGVETLACGDAHGHLYVWDLNERRLICDARGIHRNGISYGQFLPGEPILVTTGMMDNSVKVHIFDDTSGNKDNTAVRLLRSRDGHYLPPTTVRFCGFDGLTMVSAGLDRELRLVCAVREVRNRAFSQAKLDKRGKRARKAQRRKQTIEIGERSNTQNNIINSLPPVIDIAARNAREKDSDFANIVTVHRGRKEAYSWRMIHGSSHKHILRPPPKHGNLQLTYVHERAQQRNNSKNSQQLQQPPLKKQRQEGSSYPQQKRPKPHTQRASSVAMSACGNYTFVGFSDGRIHSFNLQSGLHQGVFIADELLNSRKKSIDDDNDDDDTWAPAHLGAVSSLCVDGCGDTLASTSVTDTPHGIVKLWAVHTRARRSGDISLPSGTTVTKLIWCETSDLLAVATTDLRIRIYDAQTQSLARTFAGHVGAIVDVCFDATGRRVVSASMDGSIKTWDLPSGRCVNSLVCNDAPTSIALAPSNDLLASTHANGVSIRLWVNCERFGTAEARRRTRSGNEHDGVAQLEGIDDSDDNDVKEGDEEDGGSNWFNAPLSEDILTLSSRPTNTWSVLPQLREMEERNRPVEGVKKGENAPFFLPTVKGVSFGVDVSSSVPVPAPVSDENPIENGNGNNEKKQLKQLRTGGSGRWAKGVSNDDDSSREEKNDDDDDEEMGEEEVSKFGQLVLAGKTEEADRMLKEGDARFVDTQIRSLSHRRSVVATARYFCEQLQRATCFELTQAHLQVFLSCHGEELAGGGGGEDEGVEVMREVRERQGDAWQRLRGALSSVACLAGLFSGQV